MTFGPEIDAKRPRALPFLVSWAILLLLAGLSLWTAFLGLSFLAPAVQFGIAAIQTVILYILFMRLKGSPSLKWVLRLQRMKVSSRSSENNRSLARDIENSPVIQAELSCDHETLVMTEL